MKQIKSFSDKRHSDFCVHCGGSTETRDHAPSLIFLDKPYPSNLSVLPCCDTCNQSFSKDEEYVACFIESVLAETTEPKEMKREKIIKIMNSSKSLRERIQRARNSYVSDGGKETIFWKPETSRLETVALKLARCHATFEFAETVMQDPDFVSVKAVPSYNQADWMKFNKVPELDILPELGSRAFVKVMDNGGKHDGWTIVQEGRYRYICSWREGISVRGVINDYLTYEVGWDD